MARTRKEMTIQQKGAIADKIAEAYRNFGVLPGDVLAQKGQYFNDLKSFPVTVEGGKKPLNVVFGDDIAQHIANLVIRRLCFIRAEMVGEVVL